MCRAGRRPPFWPGGRAAAPRPNWRVFAQEQLGDVVYLELPAEGTELTAGAPFGEIESAKTVAELFAPVSGELIGVNGELEDRPELVNESPFDEGWIVRVRVSDAAELDNLLDADAYRALIPED
ncbi:MAG: glycine cleavage system protein H [Chloroflexi bacterium]|nr:glycine cleavage system protein H [Chloroflexota bacterium]